jgi:uncharacterized protein
LKESHQSDKIIIMEEEKMPLIKRDKVFKEILEKNRVKNISIFGSYSTGENHEGSDVDFLVEFQENSDLLDMVGLKLDLEKLLGKKVDVVTKNALSPHLQERILSQAIPL